MRFPILLALLCLPACTTVDELRARPVSWTAVYPARFDVVANCLAVRMGEGTLTLTVIPQVYQADQRAVLTGAAGQRMAIEYSVRQISDAESEVSFRRVPTAFNNEALTVEARALADRCGRGAA